MSSPKAEWLLSEAYRWRLLVVLLLTSALSFADRTVFAVVSQLVKQELRLSDFQLGALQGIGFALVYSLAALPIARTCREIEPGGDCLNCGRCLVGADGDKRRCDELPHHAAGPCRCRYRRGGRERTRNLSHFRSFSGAAPGVRQFNLPSGFAGRLVGWGVHRRLGRLTLWLARGILCAGGTGPDRRTAGHLCVARAAARSCGWRRPFFDTTAIAVGYI